MSTMVILFTAEFKRFWTPGMIAVGGLLVGLGAINPIVMTQAGMFKTLSQMAAGSQDMISFFVLLVFYGGIVSSDIKSGWMRTLLIRAVTRQQYVVTKMLVALSATAIVYGLAFVIPAVVLSFDPALTVTYNWGSTAVTLVFIFAHFSLLIVLSTLVSCSLPGVFNGVFVYAWYIIAQLVGFMVDRLYWDVRWAVVLKEYLFPSGFDDAMKAFAQHMPFPTTEVLWGCAALCFFFALTLFSINTVVVDAGSD